MLPQCGMVSENGTYVETNIVGRHVWPAIYVGNKHLQIIYLPFPAQWCRVGYGRGYNSSTARDFRMVQTHWTSTRAHVYLYRILTGTI